MPQLRGFRDGKGNPRTKPRCMGFELGAGDGGRSQGVAHLWKIGVVGWQDKAFKSDSALSAVWDGATLRTMASASTRFYLAEYSPLRGRSLFDPSVRFASGEGLYFGPVEAPSSVAYSARILGDKKCNENSCSL